MQSRPEKQIKALESAIHEIIEESIIAQSKEEFRLALDKAKEAVNKERSLLRQKEQFGVTESNNDLAFMVGLLSRSLRVTYLISCLFVGHVQSCQSICK